LETPYIYITNVATKQNFKQRKLEENILYKIEEEEDRLTNGELQFIRKKYLANEGNKYNHKDMKQQQQIQSILFDPEAKYQGKGLSEMNKRYMRKQEGKKVRTDHPDSWNASGNTKSWRISQEKIIRRVNVPLGEREAIEEQSQVF